MKRYLTIVLSLAMLLMASSAFGAGFGWTISGSAVDPNVNTGTATNGVASLYLWLQCGVGNGMASAEFDLCATGINPLAFTALPPFLNAGGSTNLLMAAGGCPNGPITAGTILVLDFPGSICPCPAASNGNNVTVECGTLAVIDNEFRGYANLGSPCESTVEADLCTIISVENDSWGAIKGLYR